MSNYYGFQIRCGCHDHQGHALLLEGTTEAWGLHYCPVCDDYLEVFTPCTERTPEKVAAREKLIQESLGECVFVDLSELQ